MYTSALPDPEVGQHLHRTVTNAYHKLHPQERPAYLARVLDEIQRVGRSLEDELQAAEDIARGCERLDTDYG